MIAAICAASAVIPSLAPRATCLSTNARSQTAPLPSDVESSPATEPGEGPAAPAGRARAPPAARRNQHGRHPRLFYAQKEVNVHE